MTLLEESGVGKIIEEYVHNDEAKGGRPNVNYYNLFAVILYAFSKGNSSLREIEEFCRYDLRAIYLMEQVRPDYTTISKHFTKVIVPNINRIFAAICKQLCKEMEISDDDAFIDGSKFEAKEMVRNFYLKTEAVVV